MIGAGVIPMDQPVSLVVRRVDLAHAVPFSLGRSAIDPAAHEATFGNRTERIQPQNMKVLVALHDRIGELVTRDQLIERCWDGRIVGEDVINRCISVLRRFAGRAGGFTIETVPKAGYRLVESSTQAPVSSLRLAIAAVLLILVAVAGFVLWKFDRSSTPTLAIETAPSDHAASAAVQDVSVRLASIETAALPPFRLITSRNPAEPADLSLQVSGAGRPAALDLRLSHGKDRTLLWAAHVEQDRGAANILSARAGASATLALSCALEALSARSQKLTSQMLRAYVTGCVRLAGEFDETSALLAPAFEHLTQRAPNFAPAWDKLLYAEALGTAFDGRAELRATIRRHLQRSRQIGLDVPSSAMAEAVLLPRNDYRSRIRALELGLKRHPRSPALELALANALMDVGRQNDAIAHATRAAAFDPISPATRSGLVWILAHSGRTSQARHVLDEAERLWPGTAAVQSAQLTFELRYGDPRRALRAMQEGAARFNAASVAAFAEARLYPDSQHVDHAISEAMKYYRQNPEGLSAVVQALAQFGRTSEAMEALLQFRGQGPVTMRPHVYFRPMMREAWRDPRFIQAMSSWGVLSYWRQTGNWPDFCFDPKLPYDCRAEADKFPA